MDKFFVNTYNEFEEVQLEKIVQFAEQCSLLNHNEPIKILDLATGPNRFNLKIVQALISHKINYNLILSDISPVHFKIGYEHLNNNLPSQEMNNIICVLADNTDLKKEQQTIPIWGEGWTSIEKVMQNPKYFFLQTGHNPDGSRKEKFENESFDLIIGAIPYGSIGNYIPAIKESARILKGNGVHIVEEHQVKEIRSYWPRMKYAALMLINPPRKDVPFLYNAHYAIFGTLDAIKRAKIKHIDNVTAELNNIMTGIEIYTLKPYIYRTDEKYPDQTIQHGDLVERSIIIHQK
ncbi:MAG: hypothetical protein ACP5N2_05825 [Candidatus Nanoarchaeia archaeon]